MRGLENTRGHYLTDVVDVETLEEEDQLTLHFFFVLDLGHLGHLQAVNHLTEDLQDSTDPRVGKLEDDRVLALFDDVADKSHHELTTLVVEALNQQLLYVKFIDPDGAISS